LSAQTLSHSERNEILEKLRTTQGKHFKLNDAFHYQLFKEFLLPLQQSFSISSSTGSTNIFRLLVRKKTTVDKETKTY
jgi:hypothetical protein